MSNYLEKWFPWFYLADVYLYKINKGKVSICENQGFDTELTLIS